MSYSKVITTKKGERYLQDLIISGEPLTFTKIVTSTRNYTKEDAKNLTDIENIKQTILVNEKKRFEEDSIQIEGTLSNEGADSAYHIQTIGVYVQGDEVPPEPVYKTDDNGEFVLDENDEPIEIEVEKEIEYLVDEEGEFILDENGDRIEIESEPIYEDILYGVAVSQEPFYMASPHQNQISLTLKLNIFVGETENIEVKVDPAGSASKEDIQNVEEAIQRVESAMEEVSRLSTEEIEKLVKRDAFLEETDMMTMMALVQLSEELNK